MLASMFLNFLHILWCFIMDPIAELDKLKLNTEEMHIDEYGHVQVSYGSFEIERSPQCLLKNINELNLWKEFYQYAKNKPEKWRGELLVYLPENEDYKIHCYVEFIKMSVSENFKTTCLQEVSEANWTNETLFYVPLLIQISEDLINELTVDESDEIMQELSQGTLNGLLSTFEKLKSL